MFECLHRSILCLAKGCKYIKNLETVIHHLINCPVHLLYCALCKSLWNVSVQTYDCNVIKSQRSIFSFLKYYHKNPKANHLHKMFFSIIIHTLRLLKIEVKLTMIYSWALHYPTFHLPLFSLNKFFNAKMELKIFYYLLLIILTNHNFFLFFFINFYLCKSY